MPDAQEYEDVGFIMYSGFDVAEGIIDAASAGAALTGLDEAIRFFNTQQSPDFVVMGTATAIGAGAGVFALGYAAKAGQKMAENA